MGLVSDRVLRTTGAPRSDAQWVAANVLDAGPGALLHGPSTLAWMGIRPYTAKGSSGSAAGTHPGDGHGSPRSIDCGTYVRTM